MIKIKRALISVSDKKGLIPFAKYLSGMGVEILSTGGTARQLREAGLIVEDVSDYTGFPEMMNGRVKTLHPKIHGGLLALRQNEEHMAQAEQNGIGMIDMVIVNLYPFESVTRKKTVTLEEAIENIDIGGPSMLRSAAKNYRSVAVVCNPDRYKEVMNELDANSGILPDAVLFSLAKEAFMHTARYDSIIADYLINREQRTELNPFASVMSLKFEKSSDLRYGENPHQQAAFYKSQGPAKGLAAIRQRHGKELSFNNYLDLNAALNVIKPFKEPAAVIIKHGNPTGVAQDSVLSKAYKNAHACDPISAFGGIIGLNRAVDDTTAALIEKSGFMECVIAPKFEAKAFKRLSAKKNLRLIELNMKKASSDGRDMRQVAGGILVQDEDDLDLDAKKLKVPTKKKPTKAQIEGVKFGWKAIKAVKSNAIILVKGGKTVGVGCGQTSRIESLKVAVGKAGSSAKGSIMISDAFLPHIDNVQHAAKAGIKVIAQTGGSVADARVIEEADKHGIAMVMTGIRHFRH